MPRGVQLGTVVIMFVKLGNPDRGDDNKHGGDYNIFYIVTLTILRGTLQLVTQYRARLL